MINIWSSGYHLEFWIPNRFIVTTWSFVYYI